MSGASRQACPVATFRPDRLPSRPFSARGSRPGTPRRSPETPPSLRPGCSLLPESARGRPLASSRRSPWTRPPGPGGGLRSPAPRGRARIPCPSGGRSGAMRSHSFCSSLGHARQHPKSEACVPKVALAPVLRAWWARGPGREGGRAAPLTSVASLHPRGALGPSRAPTLAAVASWQVTWSWPRGLLGPRRRTPCGARLGGAPGPPQYFPTFGSVEDPQNFCSAVKIASWDYILFIFRNLFNIFNGFFFLVDKIGKLPILMNVLFSGI